ncbi:MAG: DoxX family protein [Acidimicrobiia bacterium]|nr:DoxX family protein [Acidimicrobiia bacterium]
MNNLFHGLNAISGATASILRVVTGFMLAWHGYRKFADGLDGFEGFLTFLELPAPATLAVIVALVELVGGTLLAVGLMTRPAALVLVVHFASIFFWVKLVKLDPVVLVGEESPGVELDLLYLSLAAFFASTGAGPLSVDQVMGLDRSRVSDAERSMATV